ncbi:MAG: DEAD/DEAH box helicase, partial [Streptococcus alactolyticus]|uniref:DEAD/DEAH box helicase n=1 Tax=Streptococcus alactolyticus TaxID=29389 RepID=UPI00374E7EF1|nr:DEAD/DEAH box helicase [Streptococcus alactolyticus]
MKFTELHLSENILKAVEKAGFEEPSPIQELTIPLALEGKDVIGQAQTGTGKTAAFGLPTLDKIDTSRHVVQALVIAPTRELAVQGQEELFRFGREKGVKVRSVYGGSSIEKQIKALRSGAHIVVGTPGRLLDLIKRKALKLDHVETLILDEADEMLNMGFLEDIEAIISRVPENRQTLLFSATMPEAIKRIGVKFMYDPEHVRVAAKELTTDLVDQYYIRVKEQEKFDTMTRLIDVERPELAIVFGRTKRRVDELTRGLKLRGYRAEGIHGDLDQGKRLRVLRDFKNDNIDILVATDVAARGLDISGVTHVYNYDIPQDPESYVHRIGRTGRAGKEGMSVTFVTPNEMDYLRTIEKLTRKEMSPLRPPSDEEAMVGQLKNAIDTIEGIVKETEADKYERAIKHLLEKYTAEELAAAFLKSQSKEASEVPVNITPERPLPSRKGG